MDLVRQTVLDEVQLADTAVAAEPMEPPGLLAVRLETPYEIAGHQTASQIDWHWEVAVE
jgi:hypothetical protein